MAEIIHRHYHTFLPCGPNEDQWVVEFRSKLDLILENHGILMATFEELKEAQDAIMALVGKVKTDVETLHAQIAAIPAGGMTPEQQAALDAAVVAAKSIVDSLSNVDAMTADPSA